MKKMIRAARGNRAQNKDKQKFNSKQFNKDQQRQIRLGTEEGLDVSWYANLNYSKEQMKQIRLGLEEGLDVSWYADTKFNRLQMEQIRLGLKSEVDVSVYADPKFDGDQMEEIRRGVQSGLDINWYTDPKFSGAKMHEIRLGLEEDVDVSIYADPRFGRYQMEEIREGLEAGVDVTPYIDYNTDYSEIRHKVNEMLKDNKYGVTNYTQLSKYEKSKIRWEALQDKLSQGYTLDEIDKDYKIFDKESSVVKALGLTYEQDDDEINFYDQNDELIRVMDASAYDQLIIDAIMWAANSSQFNKKLKKILSQYF